MSRRFYIRPPLIDLDHNLYTMCHMSVPGQWFRRLLIFIIFGIGAISIAVMTYIIIPPSQHQLYPEFNSYRIYDHRGELLQEVLSRDFTTSVWRPLSKISPYLITCTVFREDRRFFNHPGIDLIAMVRAITQNLKHGSITSGGSTITMQVAKFALNIKNRGFIAKIKEILFALKLEFHLNKSKILEIYLNRAPYGNMNYGSESASRFYFDKKCDAISWGEAALLSCLPQAPSKCAWSPQTEYAPGCGQSRS